MFYKNNSYLIKKIIDSTDIVKLISTKLNLIKKGSYYFSLCPFHKENTPSFIVNKNFYYCFGCKSYGNVINFLMNFDKLSFIDSIKVLSNINNFNFYLNKNYKYKKFNILYESLDFISKIYFNNIFKKNNNILKLYFIKKKWSIDIVKNFNIGYSSNSLINEIKNDKKKFFILYKLGMLRKLNNNFFDILCNRIIFPIHNEFGNIIAFGGRTIINKNPKYINSPESLIFKKKCNLYGLYQVKNIYGSRIPKLILVEGYTDVISLFNYGIDYSISSLGTCLSKEQIFKIFEYTNELILCYDGDKAGYNSLVKSFLKILPYITDDRKIKIIILNNDEDPDSFIRKVGKNGFINKIKKSIDISEFLFKFILKINNYNLYNKIYLINEFIKYINIIPGKLLIFFLKKKLCCILNIKFDELNIILNKKKIYNNFFIEKYNKYNPICIGINLLINFPSLHKLINIPSEIILIKNYDMKLFLEITKKCCKFNINNKIKLLNLFKNNENIKYIIELSNINTLINKDEINIVFKDLINKIYLLLLKHNLENLIIKEKSYGLSIIEKKFLIKLNSKIFKLHNNIK